MSESQEKPKFDKKKWRTQKYSKKARVDEWQAKRKKYIQGKYFRMLQKEGMSKNPNLVPLGDKSESKSEVKIDRDQKKKSFRQAKDEFERRKKVAEKKQKADDKRQKYLEKQEAIKAYKSKKAEKFKVLSKKNSKGQPIMAGRMELLLEKIKASS